MLATWGTSTGRNPTLDLQFAGATSLDNRITFSRGTTATYFNSAGVLTTAGTSEARFDYNPSTLAAQGLLIEEQRTNSIRNNTMQGAVAGTPGTIPTNWAITTTSNGLTRTISTGTENGIIYIDVRYVGTTTAASFCIIRPEAINQVAAASGQSWTSSVYMRVAAGSTANIVGFEHWVIGADAGGATTESTQVTPAITGTMTRFTASRTMNNASTAFVYPYVAFTFNNGAAIDITLRIGLPQLEQGAFATSVIPTTTTALTRNADVASMTGTNFSSWYNAAAGTLFAQAQLATGISAATPAAFLSVDDGTSNNRIQLRRQSPGTIGDLRFVSSGGNFTGTATSGTLLGSNKQIYAATASDQAAAVNGVLMTGITPVTPMPTVTQMQIGQGPNSAFLNGYVQRISYYPVRLPNSTLQALTA